MRLKIRQYFCNHDFYYIARHNTVSQNLWKCRKCSVYYIQSYLLDIGYKSKTPHIEGWDYENTR